MVRNKANGPSKNTKQITCTGFGKANGASASMVTTQGEIVVAKFFAVNGPSGTYSHFWISRAEKDSEITIFIPTKDRSSP